MQKDNKYISLGLMMVITIVTQGLTLIKTSVVARIFGATNMMDAYSLANSIVSFVFAFCAAGISTIIIPEYVRQNDRKIIDGFISFLYGIIFCVMFFIFIFRYQIIDIFSNRNEEFISIVANIIPIILIMQFFMSYLNVTVAYFQSKNKYIIPKILSFFSQLMIVLILVFTKNINIIQYTIVLLSGSVINCIFDILIAMNIGWRYKPNFIFSEDVKKLFEKFLPIVFSSGIYQLSIVVDSIIASFLETGKLTLLGYSSQISTMLNSIIIGNMLLFIYPKIIKHINDEGNQKKFWEETIFFHLIVCLVVSGFITVGKEVVSVFLCHGNFTKENGNIVYLGTVIYISGQTINIIRDLIYRYFYAKGNTKIPAQNSVMVSIVNIVVSFFFVKIIGYYGIICGTVIASTISLISIFVRFKNNIGFSVKVIQVVGGYCKNILITFITVVVVMISKKALGITNDIISIIIFGSETLCIYSLLQLANNKKYIDFRRRRG